jgi:type I restriction enzyme R subunit
MTKIYDEESFGDAIEAHLCEHGGYTTLPSDEFDAERGFFPDTVVSFIEETQPEKWSELETRLGGDTRGEFLAQLDSALDRLDQGTLEILRHGFKIAGVRIQLAYFQPETGFNPDLRERYAANRLTVTRELHYSTSHPKQRLDLCLAVNGLPVATAELKNQWTDQTVENAKAQYKNSRGPDESILTFKRGALVHFAVDTNEVAYTTELDGEGTHFLPFNRGHNRGAGNPPTDHGHRTNYLWEEVWAQDSWLDIIQRFIHLDVEEIRENGRVIDTEETMIFPRYHQLDCVRKLTDAARTEGAGEDYLIQHSTGSGKSKSIGWLAHRFVSLHDANEEPVFDSVVVVTDRTVLDDQLQDTIYDIDHQSGVVHGVEGENRSKSDELAEYLEKGKDIVITTLQTFPYVVEHVASLPERNYAVIVDEAHSSQTGEMAKEMKEILSGVDVEESDDWETLLAKSAEARGSQENLSFFAFTATPKGKTLESFGTPPEDGEKPEPFHVYSMRQAIEEGFILDVLQNYTTYDTYYNLVKESEEDPQLPEKEARGAIARFLKLHPHNIAQKVEIIVEHYRSNTRSKIGGRAKAMVVTDSRKAAVRYKRKIDEYLLEEGYDDLEAFVAFSGTVEDNGGEYTEKGMNDGLKQSELPSTFASSNDGVLVVAEKYQTGFDEPLLHTMYVDKKLSGVQAVQTLSRLNRTAPGKDDTFVLDFVNDHEQIKEAFEPFYERTTVEETTDPQHIYQLATELRAFQVFSEEDVNRFAEAFFAQQNSGPEQAHAELSQYTQSPRDEFITLSVERQDEFRSQLRSFIRLYKFQSQIVNYTDTDLEKLYTLGHFLYNELPRDPQDARVEFEDELALQYYRIEKSNEGQIGLEGTSSEVSVPTETGTRMEEEDEVELSTLVERINEQLGTDFTAADELFLQQVKEEALNDDQLQQSARVNTQENFAYTFDERLTELFIDRRNQNEDLFTEYINDNELQELITGLLRQRVYDASQEPAES